MSTTIETLRHEGAVGPKRTGSLSSDATWLKAASRTELATAADASPQWVFPEGDELFRGIYTRAGTGFSSDVLGVCSAIAGEGSRNGDGGRHGESGRGERKLTVVHSSAG